MANVVDRLYTTMRTNPKSFAQCLSFVSDDELTKFNIPTIFKKMMLDGLKLSELPNVAESITTLVEGGMDINQTATWTIQPENTIQIVTLAHVIASWGDSSNPIFENEDHQLYRNFIFTMEGLGMLHDTYDREGRTPYEWACKIDDDPERGQSLYKHLIDVLDARDKIQSIVSEPVKVKKSLAESGGKI